jgi:hypothetical protein
LTAEEIRQRLKGLPKQVDPAPQLLDPIPATGGNTAMKSTNQTVQNDNYETARKEYLMLQEAIAKLNEQMFSERHKGGN